MTPIDAKRAILNNDTDVMSIAVAPNQKEFQHWLNDVEFRNEQGFEAFASGMGNTPGFCPIKGCLSQLICVKSNRMRRAWANCWPEHLSVEEADVHTFDNDSDTNNPSTYYFKLECWKVKSGILSKKYLIFISASYSAGTMPLGFAPARDLRHAIGRANLVMSGDETPFRSVKMALADREL